MEPGRATRLGSAAPQRRRPPFVLTPLIDIIFLLLIFFMLSSQVSPYSLLPLGRVAGQERAASAAPPDAGAAADLSLRVAAGVASVGGETVPLAELPPVLQRLVGQGVDGFLVIATRSASVQDVVSVLEALREAPAGRVTLMNAGAAP